MRKLNKLKLYEEWDKEYLQTLEKEDLIEKLEGWIRSIEQQEDWPNATIFAKEEMQEYLEELKNKDE